MKKLILGLLFFCLPAIALADEVTVTWEMPPTNAHIEGFRVYKSDDLGQTWQLAKEVNATVTQTKLENLPSDHLILFRVSAYNQAQESIRTNAGAWYNGEWTVPPRPRGAGSKIED